MSTQRTILDLNDDCLYQVYKFLPITDWCSLRDTCTRLRTISDYCFERQSKTFKLKQIFKRSAFSLNVSTAKRVLRSFGGFIKTVTLDLYYFRRQLYCGQLVPFLGRYCGTLRDLELNGIKLPLMAFEEHSRQFSNLHRLVMRNGWCDDEAFSSFLAQCTSLTELELIGSINRTCTGNSLAGIRLKFLKSFKLSCCEGMSYEPIKSFFILNHQLTQVNLLHLRFRDGYNAHSILEDIVSALPKLEVLSLNFDSAFTPDILPVTAMTSLKKLEASFEYVYDKVVNLMLSGLALHESIKDLHLVQFNCTNESIGLLCSLKGLKILKFTKANGLGGGFCKALASGLVGLDEIHIYECKDISFNEIKEFVVSIPTLKKIIFNYHEEQRDFFEDLFDNRGPIRGASIAPEMFLSLVEIRKRQAANEILSIYVNNCDLRHIEHEFASTGVKGTIDANANVLKMLPLDGGHRRTAWKYGSREWNECCGTCGFHVDGSWLSCKRKRNW